MASLVMNGVFFGVMYVRQEMLRNEVVPVLPVLVL